MIQPHPFRLITPSLAFLPLLFSAFGVQAEEIVPVRNLLEARAAPSDSASAMYDLSDLYERLESGAAGATRSGGFAEPTGAPAPTMYRLNTIMSKMPAVDDADGATAAQVLDGKTFWGLRSDGWGLLTGTLDNSGLVDTSSGTAAAGDILSGKKAWVGGSEITGNLTCTEPTGNADLADVLSGKTFSNNTGIGKIGTMTNNGAGSTITPSTADQSIAAGYWSSDNTVAGDADLKPENIKAGVNLFDVNGSLSLFEPLGPIADPYRYVVAASAGNIIRDTITGLEWKRCVEGMTWDAASSTCTGTASTWSWNGAKSAFETADSDGFRLPTIDELRTLVYCSSGSPETIGMAKDSQCSGSYEKPTIFSSAFPGAPADYAWSVTQNSYTGGWSVHFNFGYVTGYGKNGTKPVRLVRGGQ